MVGAVATRFVEMGVNGELSGELSVLEEWRERRWKMEDVLRNPGNGMEAR